MVIKRIGPLSCARIGGVLYAVMGLLFGVILAVVSAVGGLVANRQDSALPFTMAMGIGAGAIVFGPLLYGAMGFVGGLVSAWLYNLLAGMIGGIEIDLQ